MTALRVQDVAYHRHVTQLVDTLDRTASETPSDEAAGCYWSAARDTERAGELDRVALETLSLLARWADDGGRP